MTGDCGSCEGFGFQASASAAGLPRNSKDKAQVVGELAVEEVLGGTAKRFNRQAKSITRQIDTGTTKRQSAGGSGAIAIT